MKPTKQKYVKWIKLSVDSDIDKYITTYVYAQVLKEGSTFYSVRVLKSNDKYLPEGMEIDLNKGYSFKTYETEKEIDELIVELI